VSMNSRVVSPGKRSAGRRHRVLPVLLVATALVLAACNGTTTQPTDVSQTSATLHGSVNCQATSTTNPCTAWFQYWSDGSATVMHTSHVTDNVTVTNLDFAQTVSGLVPNTLYHYQLCGYGDGVGQPGICVSPASAGGLDTLTSPGTEPDVNDLSATQNFRSASSNTARTIDLGRVLSGADKSSAPISRDAGVSTSYLSGKTLWIFGDTSQNHGGVETQGSAIFGPFTAGEAPQFLNELPTPPATPTTGLTSPSRFFPLPSGLLNGSGGACQVPAAWTSGAQTEPGSSTVLLSYGQVCVDTFNNERSTLVEYNPTTNTFGNTYTPFSTTNGAAVPGPESMANPVFGSDGYLYFFVGTSNGVGVGVARVAAANHTLWGQSSAYQWWSQPVAGQPAGWNSGSAGSSHSVSVLPAGVTPVGGANVEDYAGTSSKHLAMMVDTFFGAAPFQIYEATSPTGPWTAGPAGQVPDACSAGTFGCYALTGHPELSSSQQLVFSWYSPDDVDKYGHVRIASVPW
jgi:predicted small secreted protein